MGDLAALAAVPVRDDLNAACETAWAHLSAPGTWWTAEERLAIVAECRKALSCDLCRERAAALSPFSVDGSHDALGVLPETVIEVIHRVRTDSGRLTESWFRSVLESGLTEEQYVEIVGVISTATALDTLARGLGIQARALPEPKPGAPTRHRPAGAKHGLAWVATVEEGDLRPEDPNPYGDKTGGLIANIHRGMSVVPSEVAAFFALDDVIYLPQHAMKDFEKDLRAISHPQIELLATRVSMINRCTY